MTCNCHEPAVFGHGCPQQTPSYAHTASNLTMKQAEIYIQDRYGQPVHIGTVSNFVICENLAAYTRRTQQITQAYENLAEATQNQPEPRQTGGNHAL